MPTTSRPTAIPPKTMISDPISASVRNVQPAMSAVDAPNSVPKRRHVGGQQEGAAERQRQVEQEQRRELHRGVRGAPATGSRQRVDRLQVGLGALVGRRALAPLAGGHRLPLVERGAVAELRPVAERRVDVEHRRLADERARADRDRPGADHPRLGPVAGDERVPPDHRSGADGDEVGADRRVLGEDHDARADLRAERPEVERVERRAGEQEHRVDPDQRADEPEAEVAHAPDRDLLRLPAADQRPLDDDRQDAHAGEAHAADHDRAQVHVGHARAGRDPVVADAEHDPGDRCVGEEDEQLERSADHELTRARVRRGGHLRGRGDHVQLGGIELGERRREAPDRRMLVAVPDRDRRHLRGLAHAGAEVRDLQRVEAELVEEVAVDRDRIDTRGLGERLGEQPFGRRHGGGLDRGGCADVERHAATAVAATTSPRSTSQCPARS